ncbi:hypothetical protein BU15DRAFT_72670 [Melanogaster broomeanus]|nr:hypothetical protein BU15DRAFT_72670 [Melanogaster broomeanus]
MPIHHVGSLTVLLKFKQGVSPEDVELVKRSLYSLPSKIPAISEMKAGNRLPHRFDHGFDEGVIFIFKDEDALRNGYAPHQAHLDHQVNTDPYVEDKLIFDISSDE